MQQPSIPSPAPDSATRNLLTRAHLAAQAARFAPVPPSPFIRCAAAIVLASVLSACGGGDPEPLPDDPVSTPCVNPQCIPRSSAR